MKYTSLKNDIVNILHSSDSNLGLKFYDENGNTTLSVDDATWGYIFEENIMIEFMTEETPTIYIWKGKDNIGNKLKNIIQRIRELSILNGVSVQIRVYDNLDQRKIYNLIKSSIVINNKEKEEMEESVIINQPLVEAFKYLLQTAKNTKKASDFYMSESIQLKNTENMLKEMISEISSLKSLQKTNITESLQPLLTASSLSDIKEMCEHMSDSDLNILNESVNDIKNIGTFVKQKYLNNVDYSNVTTKTEFVLENVKVYTTKIKNNKEDLINAYNKLITVAENVKSGIELLKEIKNHKILETFNVSKKDLLDLWLTKNHTPIKERKAYVIENFKGEKIAFNENLSFGIRALAQYINNGGEKDSSICKNIVAETIKYNNIANFIIEYKDNYSLRNYIPLFKEIFNETVNKLNSANSNFDTKLFESVEEFIDYSSHLKQLNDEMGIDHPALKYLAMENAKYDYHSTKILNEQIENDLKTLIKELRQHSSISSVIANGIVENKLNVKNTINESVDKNNITSIASTLYNELNNRNDKISSVVSSSLFNIIHTNKKLVESKIDYMKTLLKYC